MAKQYSPEEQVKRLTKKLETEKKRGEHFFSMYLQERSRAENFLQRIETLQEIEKHDKGFIDFLKSTTKTYQEIISQQMQQLASEPDPDNEKSESDSEMEEPDAENFDNFEATEKLETEELNSEQLNNEITDLLLSAGLFPCRTDSKNGKRKGGHK